MFPLFLRQSSVILISLLLYNIATKKEAIAKSYQTKLQAIDKSITATIEAQAKAQGYDIVLAKTSVLYGGQDITAAIAKVVK